MAKTKRNGKQASNKNTHGSGHGHGAKNNKSIVADSAFKALFGGRLDRYTVDPVYEWDEEIDRLVERPYPKGLTDNEIEVLKKVQRKARKLDWGIGCGRVQIGRTTLLGLFPIVGPCIDAVMSISMVYIPARKVIKKKSTRNFMKGLQTVNAAVNIVLPEIGDVLNAMFKVNTVNANILYEYLEEEGQRRRKEEWSAEKIKDDDEKWNKDRKRARKEAQDKSHGCCCCCF